MAAQASFPPSNGPGHSAVNAVMSSASSVSPSVSDSTLPNDAFASRPALSGSSFQAPPGSGPIMSDVSAPTMSLPYGRAPQAPAPTPAPTPHISQPQPLHQPTLTNNSVPQHMIHDGFDRRLSSGTMQAPPAQFRQPQPQPQPQHPTGPPPMRRHTTEPYPGGSPVTGKPPTLPLSVPQPPPHEYSVPPNARLASPNSVTTVTASQEYQDLVRMVSAASPDVVRQVIRDRWEKALLGSQYHVAFLLNATLHQANDDTLIRAVKDFGSKMVKVSKPQIVRHLSADDFDEIADLVLSKVSPGFLDKAIARRFETIPARQLVNALARAERLGYDVQDLVQEEHVIPSLHSLVVPSIPSQPVPSQVVPSQFTEPQAARKSETKVPLPVQPPSQPAQPAYPSQPYESRPGDIVHCFCGWPCSSAKAQEYHLKKSACNKVEEKDRVGKDLCPHCGCRFTSGGGLIYHNKVNVCGAYTEEQTKKMANIIAAYRAEKRGESAKATPSQAPPTWSPYQTQSTPGVPKTSASTPLSDPYSKLSPDQRASFDKEMRDAEEHYGGLMKVAMRLDQPEQDKQMASLKNRYNTKQSVTRKKYGIRLRERRSKAQIDAERTRLFGTPDGPSLSGRDGPRPASKKARTGEDGQSVVTAQASISRGGTSWNNAGVAEKGGMSGPSATFQSNGPVGSTQRPQEHQAARVGEQTPGRVHSPQPRGTQDEPLSIDDDSSGSESESDDDIPASLPIPQT
ncbi:hypothetical protein B0J13DRAFT_31627 [Dactylonectria estremocensis]|uniref:Uncharacterized protein n=1 Tax=Dactylonectria estremocensis TaxID=1079267 RepID=A0A9P9FJ62_9HYPO|nr:hypothetical protein B0J13DRAFT_31627 [Dactylonectria estremocensis]